MASTDEQIWANAKRRARVPVVRRQAEIVARYRTTDQFKSAWEIISPDAERRAECEHRIVYTILLIQRDVLFAKRGKRLTTAEWKKDLKKRIKKLHAAESAVQDEHLADRLIDERERMEEKLAMLDKYAIAQKGKPQRSEIRETAVHQAHELLRVFGSKGPSLYRDGAWHNLAKVLFGNEDADLFDYLERYRPPEPTLELTYDGRWVRTEDPPLHWLDAIVGERRQF